jgi:hypothetical protein
MSEEKRVVGREGRDAKEDQERLSAVCVCVSRYQTRVSDMELINTPDPTLVLGPLAHRCCLDQLVAPRVESLLKRAEAARRVVHVTCLS